MRDRRRTIADRQRYYRMLEAESARDAMDRAAEDRRKAGLVNDAVLVLSLPSVTVNPHPATAEEIAQAIRRALLAASHLQT